MKIGIMGGTFNPIHVGHLLLGQSAYEEFHLDEVWFLPNGNPPHKHTEENTEQDEKEGLSHRIEMIRQSIRKVPYFKLCLDEARVDFHSYTYRTMKLLCEEYPGYEFYFILGADSLFTIEEWKDFQKIFPLCVILAAMRGDKNREDMKRQAAYLEENYGAEIRLLDAPVMEISSTSIRKRALEGLSIRFMVPDAVADYIRENRLYHTEG